jgi:signal transduction histidine kinase
LLRFARREEFHFEHIDIGELARATTEQFRPRLEADGIELHLNAADGVVASADREKLRGVIINLIENAVDALQERSASRRLSLAVSTANGTATVQVTDNGPGVPPDVLARLFEPFFSLKAKGTGLGLAIAKRTIEAHGGHIEASSIPGAEMTLRISLPLAAESADLRT